MKQKGLVESDSGKFYCCSPKDGHVLMGGWARGQVVKGSKTLRYYYYLDKTGAVTATVKSATRPAYTPKK